MEPDCQNITTPEELAECIYQYANPVLGAIESILLVAVSVTIVGTAFLMARAWFRRTAE